ncbi:MAG TPA: lipid-binding SYLF domain-containing protein [Candidatus Angelobacter sp.]|nr:lipid-binding SYLF domain-containing protein [Candidatus Angelobacter sp.]
MKSISMFVLFVGLTARYPLAQQPGQASDDQQQAKTSAEIAKEATENKEKQADRLKESKEVLKELLSGKTNIPHNLLQKAKCVVVIPSVKRLAFTFGVSYGRGAMTCRLGENFNGPWSAPSMYALEGGNFGLQIGVQGTDLVLLVINERGVDSLLRSKIKLGGDVSVAAGPIGRQFQASTDLNLRAQILAYSRTRGVFAGIALDGSTLRPDGSSNNALYGKELTAKQIVRSGTVPVPHDAVPLIQLLTQSASQGSVAETSPK